MSSRADFPITHRMSGSKGPIFSSAEIARGGVSPRGWGVRLNPAHCHPIQTGWSAIGVDSPTGPFLPPSPPSLAFRQ
jgi:hypothetical protein